MPLLCPFSCRVYFNPRSPDGERQIGKANRQAVATFQSTLPGWGATVEAHGRTTLHRHFNPRSPDGERLGACAGVLRAVEISIHAPRMGSDVRRDAHVRHHRDFNPRSPDGERRRRVVLLLAFGLISIHAPRMGSDRENGHLRPRYGQNHPFSTLIVSQIVVDVLGTVRKSQKHQRTSHYEVIKQPERRK